ASTRAAANSALRAGLEPWCFDLFADADLQGVCHCRRIGGIDYPDALLRLHEEAPPGPWLFTGAIENRPGSIGRMNRLSPLWGNKSAAVGCARDPEHLHTLFERERIASPSVRLSADDLADEDASLDTWLMKPFASAGGRGIQRWRGDRLPPGYFAQE